MYVAEQQALDVHDGLVVAHVGGLQTIGTARAQTFQTELALLVGDGGILGARGYMYQGDDGSGQDAVGIGGCTRHRGCS